MEKYYIAYGSNLNKMQMSTRCPSAKVVGTAVVDGWRLLYRRSYLTIEQKPGYRVPVGIWKVTEDDEKNLDRYEGFPRFYIKKEFKLNVKLADGTHKRLPCFAYIMNNGFPLELPSYYYCSSTGAIPELPHGQKIKEINKFDPDKVVGCYSQSKAMATQLVLDACAEGLDASIVHPSGILGPEDYAVGETTGVVIQIIKGEMPAGIAGSFNLCDVQDLANGLILASEKGGKGECYILGNDEVTFKDFSRILSKEAHCKKMKFFLPTGFATWIASKLEKAAKKKKGTRPLMTTFSVYNLARNNVFDSSKAKEELGYTTRSYEETIRDEVEWLKKTGKIA